MKSKSLLLLGAALGCLFTAVNSAFAQGTAFTYNGLLKEKATGQPADGSFDLRFILYNADPGGSQVGPSLTIAPLGVTNGLFTATLDFGAGIFEGSARWLEIGVRTNGSVGTYDILSRTRLTPTPYAIYAANAASAATATTANSATTATSVPWNGLTGVPAGFADGTDNDTTYTAGAGLNLTGIQFSLNFAGSGSASTATRSDHTHTAQGDATTLDGLDSTAFALLNSSPVFSGDLEGARLRVGSGHDLTGPSATIAGGQNNSALNAFAAVGGGANNQAANSYATVSGGLANTNNGLYSVIPGGRNNRTQGNDSLAAGRRAKALNNGAFVWADSQDADFASTGADQFLIRASGGVGIGTANPVASLYVTSTKATAGDNTATFYNSTLGGFHSHIHHGLNGDWYIRSAKPAGNVVLQDTGGKVGIGTASPKQALHVTGDYYGHGHLFLYAYEGDGASGTAYVQARDDSTTSSIGMILRTQTNGVVKDAITMSSDGNLVSVRVLQIIGGMDVAEPFPMTGKDIPKGAVVVIDEEQPGQLKLSDRSYDTRVAGIVSGANGVNPGLTLSQQGLFEGGQNVALSGRVYALADASRGAIKPGDLLTTSAVPGHAMKAADPDRAQGAILGKAMSGLKEGKGLVLVLVSLQ